MPDDQPAAWDNDEMTMHDRNSETRAHYLVEVQSASLGTIFNAVYEIIECSQKTCSGQYINTLNAVYKQIKCSLQNIECSLEN